MGRTNPTYRDQLRHLESDWEPFRRALRAVEQDAFDQLFEHGRAYAHAASYCNHTDPERALLVSTILAHERKISQLEAQLEAQRADDREFEESEATHRADACEGGDGDAVQN